MRTFLDLGEPMRKALLKVRPAPQGAASAYARHLLDSFAAPAAPQDAASQAGTAPQKQTASRPVQPLIEPLSERERQVLVLLAEGRTRSEIAQALYVSVNTIKAHLKGIYGKLGVHTRRAAVDTAREHVLLS